MIQLRKKQEGQALIEYALLVLIIIGIYAGMNYATTRGIGRLWIGMAKEIAAGCPTCTPPDEIR